MEKYYSFTFSYFIFRILSFKTFIFVSVVMNKLTNPLYSRTPVLRSPLGLAATGCIRVLALIQEPGGGHI